MCFLTLPLFNGVWQVKNCLKFTHRPTPLALSIEKTINSSSEAKLSQSWDSKAFKDETVHRKDVTYGEAEDEAIDDVFCGPEDVTETTGKLPPTRRPDSQRSSGYLSYGRSSDCSRCSEFSGKTSVSFTEKSFIEK